MSEKIQTFSHLFTTFAGSYVTIAVKSLRGLAANKKVANVMLAGYLLDECETFYYIGDTPDEIFAAIRREDVITIMMGGEEVEQVMNIPDGQEMQ